MEKYAIDTERMKKIVPLTKERLEAYKQKSYKLVGLCMNLYNELGYGYAEPIYQECMKVLCDERGIPCEREKLLKMTFHGNELEKVYKADIVCYDDIIVEFKSVSELLDIHRAQLFNYLRITHSACGVLVNFGGERGLHAEKYLYSPLSDRFELIHQ